MQNITYKTGVVPDIATVAALYDNANLARPTADLQRIEKMYANSNIIVTAWNGDQLVGVSRALTDFGFCCYLSDLAVLKDYQRYGVGKRLLALTKKEAGDESMMLLLSSPVAMTFYPHMGMDEVKNAFIIPRVR